MTKIFTPKDPVTLSGGPCAGRVVEGSSWTVATESVFRCDNQKEWKYRRLEDDDNGLTADQAVFTGKNEKPTS